jgi:hypothetical protein
MKLVITKDGVNVDLDFSEDLVKSDDDTYVAFLEDAIMLLQSALLDKQYSVE